MSTNWKSETSSS